MKAEFLKHTSIFFGYLLEACIEIWQNFLKYIFQIMVIENLKKPLDFST
jgi:hypothetical protein